MYRITYFKNVSSTGVAVSRQMFDEILDSPEVSELCQQIVDTGNMEIKRKLPAFCWHATFENGKRNSLSAIPSGLAMIDVDHCEKPREVFETVKELAIENGLVAAHVTPSTSGLRMVFVMPDGMTIEGTQKWLTEKLALEGVDGCTKDLARLSFAVPRSYWLYIDYEALFGEKIVSCFAPTGLNEGDQSSTQGSRPGLESSAPLGLATTYDTKYKGVLYTAIVEALETLYGGKPAHGNRNTQIFSMACMLRNICNDDPNWIAQILPNYGEAESRWMSTIKSACQRNQVKNMPPMLTKAIEMARLSTSGIESNNGETTPLFDSKKTPDMPSQLPHLISLLIRNVPDVCRASVANGVFPALASHLSEVRFPLIDGTRKEATFMCVNMARQSSGKASVNKPIELIMRDIKERDDYNRQREQDWKDAMNSRGSNKDKPKRPDDLCVQILVSDMTNAAFVQRLKDAGNKYLYTNLEELDLLKQLQTNGSKDVGKIICLCFDNGVYGQERVGTQSVTALTPLRWNWNASSTVEKGREFFRNRLIDGTLSRINFCTIISDETKEFKYGNYDEQFSTELKPYITNLNLCKGEVTCKEALDMAERLQKECTEIALQSEDVIYQEFAYRAVTIAYMKAMVLYIANDMTWSKPIEEFCEWSLKYDLWCKNYFFGEAIMEAREASKPRRQYGKGNMLNSLPDVFSKADAQEIRRAAGKDVSNTNHMLAVWAHRGYIVFNEETEMYEKTEKYKMKI